MEYDPDNLSLLDELKDSKYQTDKDIVNERIQKGLTKLDSKLVLKDMEFVVTHRNCTNYYKYNGRIYGCYMTEKWHLESRNADKWIAKNTPETMTTNIQPDKNQSI